MPIPVTNHTSRLWFIKEKISNFFIIDSSLLKFSMLIYNEIPQFSFLMNIFNFDLEINSKVSKMLRKSPSLSLNRVFKLESYGFLFKSL